MSKLYYNSVVLLIVIASSVGFFFGISQMNGPIALLDQPVSNDNKYLPEYLLRTSMRFIIAMFFSVIISVIYAALASKNKRIGHFLIALLDVFQSIPVLGYLSFTVTAFLALSPDNVLGVEFAIIFAVFTSQVWNMIFSVYQSFISTPKDLYEAAQICKLNKWKIFWQIELPFAIPGLVWNMLLSMSASWFFIVAQEVIIVGTHNYTMPGMGAFISNALTNKDIQALLYAFLAMISLIIFFNELIFNPLLAWSYKFRYEFNVSASEKNQSWLLECISRSSIINIFIAPFKVLFNFILNLTLPSFITKNTKFFSILFELLWWGFILWAFYNICQELYDAASNHITLNDITHVIIMAVFTTIRVILALLSSSLLWLPIGIFIGLRPKISSKIQPIIQFFTAIPANFYWPIFVVTIVHFKLDPNIWLSMMMTIGAQWYILFNIIGGTQNIPSDLLEAAKIYKLTNYTRLFKIILPAIFPFYVTGLITASGAAWNASILSEIITWGDTTLLAQGLGSYITKNTNDGNTPLVILGVIVMVVFVLMINHIIWKPLYQFASMKFRLG